MSNSDLTSILCILLLLVGLAQLLGGLFVKLRQPKVVGEILAGVVLGPALLGRLPFIDHLFHGDKLPGNILDFVYWLGLLLLMFLSGAETRQLFTRDERREVGWLAIVGTGLPFLLALLLGPRLIRPSLAGPNGNRLSLIIVLAVGVAVTSVPVVSKIFADLKILHTRFARLVLGVAVLEDIVLWLALAVATAVAGKAALNPRALSFHLWRPCLLRAGADHCSANRETYQQIPLQCACQACPTGVCDRSSARVLRSGWSTRCQPGLRRVPGGLCGGTQEAPALRRSARCYRQSLVRVLHSGLLRNCGIETGPGAWLLIVDAARVSCRKLPGESFVRVVGGKLCRLPRT